MRTALRNHETVRISRISGQFTIHSLLVLVGLPDLLVANVPDRVRAVLPRQVGQRYGFVAGGQDVVEIVTDVRGTDERYVRVAVFQRVADLLDAH